MGFFNKRVKMYQDEVVIRNPEESKRSPNRLKIEKRLHGESPRTVINCENSIIRKNPIYRRHYYNEIDLIEPFS